MTPASSRGARKAIRDAFQAVLAVVAGGGSYVLLEAVVGTLNPLWGAALTVGFKVLVAYAQNRLEAEGKIGVMLPTPGLVTEKEGGNIGKAVGTLDAVTTGTGDVVGQVVDTTGDVVGNVTGAVGGLLAGDG